MQIYLFIQDDRQGPFTPEEIAAKLQSGECTPETLAWKEGLEAWQPLRDVLPQSEAAPPQPLPVAPPPLSETSASKPVMVINERTSQRSRMKPRRPNGLAGGCFMFCVGSVMCFLAFLLCLTGIGAILGVPIFIAGMGIAYVAAPAIGIALGSSNKANRVARGPRPSTNAELDLEDEPSALPQPSAPPALPEMPAAKPATVTGGSNAFFDFFRAYRGMIRRIKSSPLPQAAQWFDRYPVIFPAAFLAFFFFGLGLIPLLLTSRLSGGDKGRLAVIAAWPLYLAMLPAIGPLLVLLVLLLPVIALVMMWVKKWFTPAVRYTVTGIVGFGVVCLIGLVAVTIIAGTKDVLVAAAKDAGSTDDKPVPYYRAQEMAPKEKRAAVFAEKRDKRLKAAEEKFKAGNTIDALFLLAPFADVLPDKESQDLYERIRKARYEEMSALLKKADDSGQGNEPTTLPLLEELDFLVSPSMWYRERLDALKKRTKIYELTVQWIKAEGPERRRLARERLKLEPENEELQLAVLEADIEDEAVQTARNIFGARYVLGVEAAKYSEGAARVAGIQGGRFPLVVYVTKEYVLTFSDLGGDKRKNIVNDLKNFFGKIKTSSKCHQVSNVYLTYGASEFYDVHQSHRYPPSGSVMEFMLPMQQIMDTDWQTVSDDEVDRLVNRFGHFKDYGL